ncbi:Sodium-dependent phosphate transporter [Crocosphaera watsonii WH 0401]|uniref:Sodium-dependent phosphate transporter n=2 Tax=Crocosphaera watsonii TaxID=263511 RepID=T2J4E3_CROWT|nr:Sodium-dependent phosphate transporter [Crocosphaera watsonii WH 0401]
MATALIQSSSTVTSIIVGLVAGGLPVSIAIPMVMGSNLGTTITNTIVSLGHIGNKEEFRKAFAAATIHDFFNLLAILIFLPLEITTHFLEETALFLAQFLKGTETPDLTGFNFVEFITVPVLKLMKQVTVNLPQPFDGIALITIGIVLIFVSILYIGKILKSLLINQAKGILNTAMGKNAVFSILLGTMVTMLVQSSSTTTSLMVPLAGVGLLSLEKIYPFILGANIGTCITALLAATAVKENAIAALEIALVHFLYNCSGVILIYGIPFLRKIPIVGAKTLAHVASEKTYLALVYLIIVFFVLPILILNISFNNP